MKHGGNIFAVAQRRGWDWREVVDFSASINPLGPSPFVRPALLEAMERMVHYPEVDARSLELALAAHWKVDAGAVLAGNGASELIHFLARSLHVGRVYLAAPVFSEFHRVFPQAETVGFDARTWPDDGLVVVTRPANPTGLMPDLQEYLAATKNPVVVDESFIEFTGEPALGLGRPNLFSLRSLTKFYAIPGLRAGALLGPAETITLWMQRREPWQVNVMAEAAVKASLADREHAARTVEFVQAERKWLSEQLREIGLNPQPSAANFILVAAPAARIVPLLEEQKILVRDCSGWPGVPFPEALRVAVRTRVENERLLTALRGII